MAYIRQLELELEREQTSSKDKDTQIDGLKAGGLQYNMSAPKICSLRVRIHHLRELRGHAGIHGPQYLRPVLHGHGAAEGVFPEGQGEPDCAGGDAGLPGISGNPGTVP